jgi:hypothetical protein
MGDIVSLPTQQLPWEATAFLVIFVVVMIYGPKWLKEWRRRKH